MARMVRKQICITDELDRRLGEMAERRGVSQSEIVREALGSYADTDDEVRQRRHEAMERFLRNARELAKKAPSDWRPPKREEIYRGGRFR